VLIHPDQPELERALSNLLSGSRPELQNMGWRGCDLVSRRYTWPAIGNMMAEVYEWVLGGKLPTAVEMDFGRARN
jgi:hypothetical protein